MGKYHLNQEITETLGSYFRAFYPLIYLYSFEEDRVEMYLDDICRQLQINLYSWNLIDGFEKVAGDKGMKISSPDTDYGDYFNCLSYIERDDTAKSCFLLKDYHPAFTLNSADQIIRKIRNVVVKIRDESKIIVFLVPPNCGKAAIPKELEKESIVYSFPVPTLQEGVNIFDQVVNESLKGRKLPNELKDNQKEKIVMAGLGLTTTELENAFIRATLAKGKISLDTIGVILDEKKQLIEKTGILEYFSTDREMTEVGGLDELKHWLDENRDMFDSKAVEAGCDMPRGILLAGVPGCGKSLTAKGMASQWKLPLLRFDLSAVFGGLVGESEANMRKALDAAESIAPCVLWVDELEKGLAGMVSSSSGDSGVSRRVFGTLISWMQDRQKPVFFVATANDVTQIYQSAPELLRSGRFDEIFFIDLPNMEERQQILAIHLKKRKENPEDFNIVNLAKLTSGFSGSDIEQVVKDAKRKSYIAKVQLTDTIIEEAIGARLPMAVTMKEKIEELRKWAALHAKLASRKENVEAIGTIADFETKRKSRRVISK